MSLTVNCDAKRVFDYFYEISQIPHGSGDMEKISSYCVNFAKTHSLNYYIDGAKNVIIYKSASKGYEAAAPIILQGHSDMVCQKTAKSEIDFKNDPLELYIDGDFLKARETTLGADNGIAVAMVLAILENNEIDHPEIQAVFTTDEEVGMLGAAVLDMQALTAKRMINLDSEDEGVVTVSCAGGADFKMQIPAKREKISGNALKITLFGLLGGHSGVDINKHRVNADRLVGRILNELKKQFDFRLVSLIGGDKSNAIANRCEVELVAEKAEALVNAFNAYAQTVKQEIAPYESGFDWQIEKATSGEYNAFDDQTTQDVIFALLCVPNGILKMSAEIEGLVETSLNLGILKTEEAFITMQFALRSNKESSLTALISKMQCFADYLGVEAEVGGYYPPWEYRASSPLREAYEKVYKRLYGKASKAEAIHAGLECSMFASRIKDIDCIAIGPSLIDVHTVNERASISSIDRTYKLILEILSDLK